jgi:hypothetical protein
MNKIISALIAIVIGFSIVSNASASGEWTLTVMYLRCAECVGVVYMPREDGSLNGEIVEETYGSIPNGMHRVAARYNGRYALDIRFEDGTTVTLDTVDVSDTEPFRVVSRDGLNFKATIYDRLYDVVLSPESTDGDTINHVDTGTVKTFDRVDGFLVWYSGSYDRIVAAAYTFNRATLPYTIAIPVVIK